MGFKKISELDPAALVNDSDLFAGVQEYENKKYTAEQLKLYFQDGTQPELTFDDAPVENSNNPVKSGGLYSEFATKQDVLTFDAMPIDGSSNPVTSDGIEEAIASSEARSIPLSQKGEAGGVAELDSSGKVLSSQLPSYVDDVEEYLTRSNFPVFGEGGKIYIALDTNLAYRWTGSGYAEISPSLALGETSSTAYRGDRGKTAYDFSQSPYASAPAMDGVASTGSSSSWARGDHVHPKDTSKQDVLTFDNTPTENSSNPVKSGGVYSALASKQDALTFDDVPVENSINPVKSGGLYSSLSGKQNTLTFDNVPVEDSSNPVKSSGLYDLTSIFAEILSQNDVYATDTISGEIASFPDGADDVPVIDLTASIEPIQSGSGDPSPSNVRSISGWTGANVTRAGKNLLDVSLAEMQTINPGTWSGDDYTHNGVVFSLEFENGYLKSVKASGTATGNAILNMTFWRKLKRGLQYILSGAPTGNPNVFLGMLKNTTSGAYAVTTGGDSSAQFTAADDAEYYYTRIRIGSGESVDNAEFMPMIRLASDEDPAFETYKGSTYSISWQTEAGTVYGGTLDVTTGVLTVTHGHIASYAGETLPGEWISDRDVYAAGTSPTTGAQVVYELASATTYQLTPTEVKTLLGENNIWADTGDTTVEYKADAKLYIDKKLSELSGT